MRLDYDTYAAEIGDDGISIFLNGRRYAVLRIPSALDSADKQDIDGPLSGPEKATYEDGVLYGALKVNCGVRRLISGTSNHGCSGIV